MTKLRSSGRVATLLSAGAVLTALLSIGASKPGQAITLLLTPEAPGGYADDPSTLARPLRQDIQSLVLRDLGNGRFSLRLGEGSEAPALESVDLRPFVPRVPALANGYPPLTHLPPHPP